RQRRAEPGREVGVHEDPRALHVARRVQSGGEEEVAVEDGPPLLEQLQQICHRPPTLTLPFCFPTLPYTAAMVPLSAVLITQDEARHLPGALESVRFCDEVVVVDCGSRDDSRAIAEAAGARVLVHESVKVRGSVGRLRNDLLHLTYDDISDHLRTIDSYTTLWARQAYAEGRRTGPLEAVAACAWAFFRNYAIRRGALLGAAGITASTLNAYYTYVKLAKLLELQQGAPPPP